MTMTGQVSHTKMCPFWLLLEPRMMEVMLTNGAERWQSSSQIVTTNKLTPGFLQAGCPYCYAANSVRKALNGKVSHSTDLFPPLTWGLPSLSLATEGFWLPWEMVAKLPVSPLTAVPCWRRI